MKTALKWIAVLVGVLVLALVAFVATFDPNAYRDEISALARDKGQVKLSIGGEMGFSLFPDFALTLPETEVRTLDGKPLAAIRRVDLGVAVMPLFFGRFEMSGLTLDGLRLDLAEPAKEGPSPDKASAPAAGSGGGKLPEVDIGEIRITDAEIIYRLADGSRVELSDFAFSGGRIVSGQPFPAESSFRLRMLDGQEQEQLTLAGKLTARLLLDLDAGRYAAEQLDLSLTLGGSLVGASIPLRLRADLEAAPGADRAAASNLRLALANLEINGDLTVNGLAGSPQMSGRLEAASFDLKALLKALGQPAPATADEGALSKLAFSATLGGPANTLTLDPLSLTIDDTRLEGRFSMDLASGRQTLRLAGNRIDLDRYLPPPAAEPAAEASPEPASAERYPRTPLLPVELLRTLNFDAELGLEGLTASGVKISNLSLKAEASDGLIRVPEISGELYQGSFRHQAEVDVRKTPPRLSIKKSVSKVQLGPLLADAAGFDRFSGILSLDGDYRLSGSSVYDWVHSLGGSTTVSLKDGRLKGINMVDKICQGIRSLKGEPQTAASAEGYTEFTNLGAHFTITRGVVSSEDLSASLIAAGLTGKGKVDLPGEALDWALDLTVLQQIQGEQCQIEEKLHNIAFPLRCRGSFDDPPADLCRPDTQRMKETLAAVYKEKAKAKVDAAKEKAKEKLEQKLEEKLKDDSVKGALKGLFGR